MGKGEEGDILPVLRDRQAAAQNYDRLSGIYDLLTARGERPYREAGLAWLDVRKEERVLEIGSGTGLSLPELAEAAGPEGVVCGVDLSPGMLRRARARLVDCGAANRAGLCRADGVHLPFRAEGFDAVWLSFTLELFDTPEIPVVLGEIRRVLVPGGRLSVAALSREGTESLMRRLYEWGHLRFPAVLDCRPIYAARAVEGSGFQLRKQEQMQYWGMAVEIVLAVKPEATGPVCV